MILAEAINKLNELAEILDEFRDVQFAQAIQLGAEALKARVQEKEQAPPGGYALLPGETE